MVGSVGCVMVVKEAKGTLCGGGWLLAKEMWLGGWESLVKILCGKGRERSCRMGGMVSGAEGTARVPWGSGELVWLGEKSTWRSMRSRAGVKGSGGRAVVMVRGG